MTFSKRIPFENAPHVPDCGSQSGFPVRRFTLFAVMDSFRILHSPEDKHVRS